MFVIRFAVRALSVNKGRQRTRLGVVPVLLTPGYGIAFEIIIVFLTFTDFGIILRAFTGSIVGISFLLAPFGILVNIHVNIAVHSVRILTVRQEAHATKGGGRREEHRESSGDSKD